MSPVIVEPKWRRDVGRITVPMKIENLEDLALVSRGLLAEDQVRSIEVDALVDTGARYVSLPTSLINQLGVRYLKTKPARTAAGVVEQRIFSSVRVTVQVRDAPSDVAEIPEGSPVLLGQIPLEQLDFWIDMTNQQLVGNPEHGGQWMIDQF